MKALKHLFEEGKVYKDSNGNTFKRDRNLIYQNIYKNEWEVTKRSLRYFIVTEFVEVEGMIDYQEQFNRYTDWHETLTNLIQEVDKDRNYWHEDISLNLYEAKKGLEFNIAHISDKLSIEIIEQQEKNKLDFDEMVK